VHPEFLTRKFQTAREKRNKGGVLMSTHGSDQDKEDREIESEGVAEDSASTRLYSASAGGQPSAGG